MALKTEARVIAGFLRFRLHIFWQIFASPRIPFLWHGKLYDLIVITLLA